MVHRRSSLSQEVYFIFLNLDGLLELINLNLLEVDLFLCLGGVFVATNIPNTQDEMPTNDAMVYI